jgi:hypothetical protein
MTKEDDKRKTKILVLSDRFSVGHRKSPQMFCGKMCGRKSPAIPVSATEKLSHRI